VLLTDFCNRPFDTSTRGTFDFRARSKLRRPPPPDLPDRSPAERASCGVEPPCGNPTPDGHALDGAQPASASSPAAAPKGAERRSRAALPSPRGYHPPARSANPPLTLPVAPARPPGDRAPSRTRAGATVHSSKWPIFPTRSAFHRKVLSGAHVMNPSRTRHRSHDFAAVESASGARSPLGCSRTEELDPSSYSRTLRPRARRATRRFSTSATDPLREHDRQIDRTPHTALPVARARSS
jgi:hypothetical protein